MRKLNLNWLLSFLAIVSLAWHLQAQVQVGAGTSTGKSIPIEPFYGYTYSQNIYLASEINASGDITTISFQFNGNGALPNSSSSWVIYLGHTTKTSFSSTTDWEPVANLTQVYSGSITATATGTQWISIDITDFPYNSTDNLIVAIDENQSGYDGSADEFFASPVSANRSMCYYSDGTNPDPSAPGTANIAPQAFVSNIILGGITQACPNPSALTATNITATAADLAWTENGSATLWDIEIGTSGFTPTGTPTSDNASNPYIANTLNGATTYNFYVRADCSGDNSNVSAWAGPFSFTTACVTYTAPFAEAFSNGTLPNCWTNTSSDPVANGLWKFAGNGDYGAAANGRTPSTFAWADGSSPAVADVTLITPWIDISGLTNPELTFEWFSNNTDTPGDNTQLIVDVYDGTTWTNIVSLSGDNPNWLFQFYSLSAFSGPIQIRFVNKQTTATSAYYNDILLDNVTVNEAITCPMPSLLAASNITTNSADLSWTNNSSATVFDIEIGLSGFTPTGVPSNNDVSNPYSVSGLNASSTYQYYVRADCGANNVDTSIWVGPFSFNTLCNVFTLNVTEGFNNTSIPNCWSQQYVTGTSNIGYVASSFSPTTTPQEGTHYVYWNSYSISTGNSTRLVSPAINTIGTASVDVEFYWRYDNSGYASNADGVTVEYSLDGTTWTAVGGLIHRYNASLSDWEKITVTLPTGAANQATMYVGFNFISAFGNNCALDNVTILPTPSCPAPSALTANNITDQTADLSWTNNSSATLFDIEFGIDGFTPTQTATNDNVGLPFTMNGLTQLTAYDYYVRADCSGDNSDASTWVGPFSFTTTASCPEPSALTVVSLTSSTVDLSWTNNSSATLFDIEFGIDGFTPTQTATNDNVGLPFSVNGLNSSTTYQYYVRADCSGDDSDASTWVGPFSFTTGQIAAQVPYTEDFETWPTGWTVVNGTQTNQWYVGNLVNNGGAQSAYVSEDGGTSHTYDVNLSSVVHLYRDLVFPADADSFHLSFDWIAGGESSWDFIKVFLVPVSTTPTEGVQLTDGILGNYFNLSTGWQTKQYTFGDSLCGQTLRLVFSWRNDVSLGTQPPAAIDNINFEAFACPIINSYPYIQDFEGTFLPECWSKQTFAPDNDITQSASENHTTGGTYSTSFSSVNVSSNYEQILNTPTFLIDAAYPTLSFWHKKAANVAEVMEFGVITTTDTVWSTVNMATIWKEAVVDLTPLVGQNIRFIARYTSDNLQSVYIDDFKIYSTTVGITPISQSEISIYPNPSTGIFNVVNDKEVVLIEVLNTQGQLVRSIKTNQNNVQVDLNQEAAGMYYIKVYQANQDIKTTKINLIK